MTRILIVDDSSVFRNQLSLSLKGIEDFEIAGTAANGKLALNFLIEHQVEIAVVDLEMPEMNGIQLLEEISRRSLPVKVILFASATKSSAFSSIQALNRGAFDFVIKPTGSLGEPGEAIRQALLPKLQAAKFAKAPPGAVVRSKVLPARNLTQFLPDAVVIGCSTGGPRALEVLFQNLGPELQCPIFITQHMPPIFTAALAERLKNISGLDVTEARHGEVVEPKHVYVAPGNYHMRVRRLNLRPTLELDQAPPRHSVRPAVDHLFESADEVYGARLLGIVLTGMGEDGRDGCVAIKKSGGLVLIQNEASCVVYGMPRTVSQSGAFDLEIDLSEIRVHLQRMIQPLNRPLGKVP